VLKSILSAKEKVLKAVPALHVTGCTAKKGATYLQHLFISINFTIFPIRKQAQFFDSWAELATFLLMTKNSL
jgi:hypothetical protein